MSELRTCNNKCFMALPNFLCKFNFFILLFCLRQYHDVQYKFFKMKTKFSFPLFLLKYDTKFTFTWLTASYSPLLLFCVYINRAWLISILNFQKLSSLSLSSFFFHPLENHLNKKKKRKFFLCS